MSYRIEISESQRLRIVEALRRLDKVDPPPKEDDYVSLLLGMFEDLPEAEASYKGSDRLLHGFTL